LSFFAKGRLSFLVVLSAWRDWEAAAAGVFAILAKKIH